ncbi:hypothetical protein JR338_12790 (plasmid) [Chloroflexota bacterium]|nr:hypothetical protein JR338_12790 [Chloroflexota bacterium]
MTLTLLDYEVFDSLKTKLAEKDPKHAASFSERVLGYGFTTQDDPLSAFVLICGPHFRDSLTESLSAALPESLLTVQETTIKVLISDSTNQHDLQHNLQITESIDSTPQANSDNIEDWVQISLGQTLRQAVLQENRKIILPAYLLRYTPFTSPNLILLRAALSQIHFLHQSRAQAEDEFEQRTVTARMNEIQRWSSFSRTSIYRLLHEDPRSAWLIRVENRGAYQNNQGQQISLPNQYLLEPLKLTPGDATDLENYLREHQAEWQDLDDCLLDLLRTDRRQMLAYPYRTPQPDDRTEPASVLEILQSMFNGFELTASRLTLIDKLRDHLMGDDFVAAPWYLLRRLLPVYGASIVVAWLMCQPLLFKHNGIERDNFWLPGGAESLVAWTNDRSFGKYFPKANAKGRGRPASGKGTTDTEWRKNKQELLTDFFLRTQTRRDGEGITQWQIKVSEMPVLPEDARLMSSVYTRLAELIRYDRLDQLITLLDKVDPSQNPQPSKTVLDRIYRLPVVDETTEVLTYLVNSLISDFGTPVKADISKFETPVDRLISLFETPESGLISKNATPVIEIISDLETHLKILESIKDSIRIIKNSNTPPDSNIPQEHSDLSEGEDWYFKSILESVSEQFRQEILNDSAKSRVFKAWLVHNALNSRVNQPLNLALNKAMQNAAPPDTAAMRLADLALPDLVRLLENSTSPAGEWGYQVDEVNQQRARDLELLLVGEASNMRAVLIQRLLDLIS